MRVTISLLVTSVLLGSLAFNSQAMAKNSSLRLSSSGHEQLLLSKSDCKKQTGKEPCARGSGRGRVENLLLSSPGREQLLLAGGTQNNSSSAPVPEHRGGKRRQA